LGVGGTTGKAQATKDGSSYKITGTASGVDMSNPMARPVSKPFELDVSCP
jgi:lipoprotein LpqH